MKPTRAEMAALVEQLRVDAHEYAVAEMFEETITLERAAADAIEALMQERAEPVAWITGEALALLKDRDQIVSGHKTKTKTVALYAAPPAKPAGELPRLPIDNLPPPDLILSPSDKHFPGQSVYTAESVLAIRRAYALRAIREME